MANQEHLAILKQGVSAWNRWRVDNPTIRADLEGAYLEGADLRGANLEGTGIKEVISLLPFAIVVLEKGKVCIGCGKPRTIKQCLKVTQDEAEALGLPPDRYALYQAILRGLLS